VRPRLRLWIDRNADGFEAITGHASVRFVLVIGAVILAGLLVSAIVGPPAKRTADVGPFSPVSRGVTSTSGVVTTSALHDA
jgi:hypothetical protein